jgi:exonuclease SbcC
MKIRELRFKNLNSLYGEWSIDFTDPAYISNGIFAITGPTGSGKSTILDALCLALYGETPRLGRVTKSTNEIMSRRTGESFAEVTFEGSGGVYRCHWSQHRARKSATGGLAESKHEIADAMTGKILESRKRETLQAVETRTGMDFNRFTRSILLAQGSFDSFLRSGSNDRAPILEQITGTEIYSRISIEVFGRMRQEEEEKKRLEAEISGVALLSEEEIHLMKEKLIRLEKEEKSKGEEWDRLNGMIQWLENITRLEESLKVLELEKAGLEEDEHHFYSQGERLKKAALASELEGIHASLTASRQQVNRERIELEQEQREIPLAEQELRQLDSQLTMKSDQSAADREQWEREKNVLNGLRELDRQSAVLKKSLVDLREEREALSQKKQGFKREKTVLEEQRETSRKGKTTLETLIDKICQELPAFEDQGALSPLIDLVEHMRRERGEKSSALTLVQKEIHDHSLLLEKVLEERNGLIKDQEGLKDKSKMLTEDIEHILEGRSLGEIRREKEGLLREQALINRINDLEEERSRLEEGKPCPLCGALEHPFSRGELPELNETEQHISELTLIIDRVEKKGAELAELAGKINDLRDNLAAIDDGLSDLKSKDAHSKARKESLDGEIEKLNIRLEQQESELLKKLSPMGMNHLPEDLYGFYHDLKERQEGLRENEKELLQLNQKIEELSGRINGFQALIESHNSLWEDKNNSLAILESDLEKAIAQRREKGGDKDPDREEERISRLINEGEQEIQKLRMDREALSTRIKERKLYTKQREENLSLGEKEKDRLNIEFQKSLEDKGFSGEDDFLACRLSTHERESLLAKGEELKKRRIDWDTRLRENTESLKKEKEKELTSQPMETLKTARIDVGEALKALGRELGSGKEQLERDQLLREDLKIKQQILEKQRREFLRWDKLNSLIGSADGKKYRNFAQGITFELMVGHANRQLIKMTDRYLLVRDEASHLDLNVIDNYQAGEIRSTKNLSGGEGFLVSLALALGLSQMTSHKVRVDSLFLDEGFGTLDEEALDMALETLSSLQQEGKLIGVISHIPALKERISCQLNVQPLRGGRSILSGHGVEKRV